MKKNRFTPRKKFDTADKWAEKSYSISKFLNDLKAAGVVLKHEDYKPFSVKLSLPKFICSLLDDIAEESNEPTKQVINTVICSWLKYALMHRGLCESKSNNATPSEVVQTQTPSESPNQPDAAPQQEEKSEPLQNQAI